MDIRKNNKTNKKRSDLYFYNTLSRSIQQFKPIKKNKVGLYTCGPTVYSRAHIGNLRAYIFADILKRVLIKKGYKVKHVMNITDVGELTGGKNGFDKMLIGAKKENITTWQVAKKYTHLFFEDCKKLNILPPTIKCNATDHIKEQIELIERLEKKGYTYLNSDGVYFDTSKLNDYGKLARLNIKELKAGSRIKIGTKKSKTDFALWKFNKTSKEKDMEWSSPWGKGFPGWHIECSAMSMKYLGEQFDIHTGGIDHIPVHHTNEIAQSEVATGRIPFVNYWLHLDFVINSKEKMSKSIGNIKDLDTLKCNGIEPSAFRYLCLTAKYRHKLSIDNIELNSAQKSYEKLKLAVQKILTSSSNYSDNKKNETYNKRTVKYKKEFEDAIFYDMNTSVGLAILWKLIKDPSLPNKEKQLLISDFDEIFGFKFYDTLVKVEKIPDIIISLAKKREKFRKKGDWKNSDRIRDSLLKKGYTVNDVKNNYEIIKKTNTKKNNKRSSNII